MAQNNVDPRIWLTDSGANSYQQSQKWATPEPPISFTTNLVPGAAQTPFTGTVQALEACYAGGAHRKKGEIFVIENYMLQANDPFVPASNNGGSPSDPGAPPTLTTPFRRDFIEAIPALWSRETAVG